MRVAACGQFSRPPPLSSISSLSFLFSHSPSLRRAETVTAQQQQQQQQQCSRSAASSP